jgi:transmembrane sensor
MSKEDTPLPVRLTKEDEAYAWVVRLDSDQRTQQDEARFDQWLDEDPANGSRFEEALSFWDDLGGLKHSEEARVALGDLYDASPVQDLEPERHVSRRAMMGGGLALAATLAAVLAIPKALTSGPVFYETIKGEQRRISLADGSTVMLDTATKISVDLKSGERLIRLEQGQAFFDVASDPTRPFRVFAGTDEIRALGTAFEVRFEGGRARVILEEGKVAIFRGGAGKPVQAKSSDPMGAKAADVVLEPGQEIRIASATLTQPTSEPKVVPVDLSRTNAWRDGEMVFDDVPLPTAVAEVNRYGGKTIVLGDPSLVSLRISGTFHTNRPEAFVEGVTAALPVRLQRSDRSKLVLSKI